jgi:hypothetical protein
VVVVDGQIPERAYPQVLQLRADPVVREISFVDAFFAKHTPDRTEQRYSGDRCGIKKLAIRHRHRQLLDLVGGQLLGALRTGGEDRTDH